MLLFHFAILMSLIYVEISGDSVLKASIKPKTPLIHTQVTISVVVPYSGYAMKMYHNNSEVGENCKFFDNVNITCVTKTEGRVNLNILKFENISWADRGLWTFKQFLQSDSVLVNISIPSRVKLSMFNSEASTKKSCVFYSNKAKSQRICKMDGSSSRRALIAVKNETIPLVCETSCAYPQPQIVWLLRNATNSLPPFPEKQSLHTKTICDEKNHDILRLSSRFSFNCHNLNLNGVVSVSCQSSQNHEYFFKYNTNQTIYILCPNNYFEELTRGELVFIVIGIIVGLLIFSFLGYLLKRRSMPKLIEERSTLL